MSLTSLTHNQGNRMKEYLRPEAEILRTETVNVLCISYGGAGKSGTDPDENYNYEI